MVEEQKQQEFDQKLMDEKLKDDEKLKNELKQKLKEQKFFMNIAIAYTCGCYIMLSQLGRLKSQQPLSAKSQL